MKNTLKVFEWVWFFIAVIGGGSMGLPFPSAMAICAIAAIVGFWLPIAMLCEFGIAMLNHFEIMEKNLWALTTNSKMIADKLSKVTFE